MKYRFLLAVAVVVLVGGFALALATSSTSAVVAPPVTASAACDGNDLVITWDGPEYYMYVVHWGGFAAPPPDGSMLTVPPYGSEPVTSSPHRLTGPGTWHHVVFSGYPFPFSPDPEQGAVAHTALGDMVFLGDFTCEPPPITASAACDGDDLVITWGGPESWSYTVYWGDLRAASPDAAQDAVSGGNETVTSSPHRMPGPGTWNNVYFSGLGYDGSDGVTLGTWTCEAVGPDPDPDPTPDPDPDPPAVYGCTFDGRLNDDFCGYPIAVYRVSGGYSIYAIDPATGDGTLVLDTSEAGFEYPATAAHTFTNWPVVVYELANGDIQINTHYADGKEYIFVISGRTGYHLAR